MRSTSTIHVSPSESPGKADNETADTADAEHAEGAEQADTANVKDTAKGNRKPKGRKAKAKAEPTGGADSAGEGGEVEPNAGGAGALDLDKLLSEARQNLTNTEQEN